MQTQAHTCATHPLIPRAVSTLCLKREICLKVPKVAQLLYPYCFLAASSASMAGCSNFSMVAVSMRNSNVLYCDTDAFYRDRNIYPCVLSNTTTL